jgi:hypothetical protein
LGHSIPPEEEEEKKRKKKGLKYNSNDCFGLGCSDLPRGS